MAAKRIITDLNAFWAELIIEELTRQGAGCFCVAPGARSAALALAIDRHRRIEKRVHFDERALGFYALAYAAASGRPSVLVATSGTAGANFLPSLVEASKKKIPVIVLTADRPPELQRTGSMQTIDDQRSLFTPFVRWSCEIPPPTTEIPAAFVLTTMDQAVSRSRGETPGPVHVNMMFREPLVGDRGRVASAYLRPLQTWFASERPYTEYLSGVSKIDEGALSTILARIQKIKRGLIVAGKLKDRAEAEQVLAFSERTGFPVFPDVTSGLRLGCAHSHVIAHFDQVLLSGDIKRQLDFDGIIHFGGRMTSRRFYQWVANSAVREYISVIAHPLRNDPLHRVTCRVVASPADLCERALKALGPRPASRPLALLQKLDRIVASEVGAAFDRKDISDPAVVRFLSKNMRKDDGLFLGNSMPIRDMDMFAAPDAASVVVAANRGASGIDGLVASACGFAEGRRGPVTACIGDLAFLHDLNSLSLLKSAGHPVVFVVINNDGGGIFSFLPLTADPRVLERSFAMPHGLTFQKAAVMFGLAYAAPRDIDGLLRSYRKFRSLNKSAVIEIKTDRAKNLEVHKTMRDRIVNVVRKGAA